MISTPVNMMSTHTVSAIVEKKLRCYLKGQQEVLIEGEWHSKWKPSKKQENFLKAFAGLRRKKEKKESATQHIKSNSSLSIVEKRICQILHQPSFLGAFNNSRMSACLPACVHEVLGRHFKLSLHDFYLTTRLYDTLGKRNLFCYGVKIFILHMNIITTSSSVSVKYFVREKERR